MDTKPTDGAALHDPDAEMRRQAARAMGSARTERKIQASRANAALATESRRGKPLPEETRALLSQEAERTPGTGTAGTISGRSRNRAGRAETRTGPTEEAGRDGKRMNEAAQADQRFVELCQEVNRRALRIYGASNNGQTEWVAEMALSLSDYVSTARQQLGMKQEQGSGYDLATLRVDYTAPSNSETGWEREE